MKLELSKLKNMKSLQLMQNPDTSVMRSKLIHCCDQGFSL